MDEIKKQPESVQSDASKYLTSNYMIISLVCFLILLAAVGSYLTIKGIQSRESSRIKEASTQTITDVWNIGQAILKYKTEHNNNWPRELADLKNLSNDTNGFDKITMKPHCDFDLVTDTQFSGCEWADDTHLTAILTTKYIAVIPKDTGKYNHYFIGLAPDESEVVIMSASSNYSKSF